MFKLDLDKGDTILTGKYRNKRETVKTFGHDENFQPTVNGRKMLTFRIEKLMPKKQQESRKLKKSEFKEIIKECVKEQLAEGKYSDDTMQEDKVRRYTAEAMKLIEMAAKFTKSGSKAKSRLQEIYRDLMDFQ